MANDANEPGQPLNPEEAAERLRKLEEEAAKLREALLAPATSAPVQEATEAESLEPEPIEAEEPMAPTPEQLEKAEKLLQRYHLEKTRGNPEIASQILKEAQALAPNASIVLEVLGDDAASRRQQKDAIEFYKRAKEADPKNASADRKHAEMVFTAQARMATLASTEFESVASARSASLFSVILPGLGHIVIGRVATGIGFMAVWILCVIGLIAIPDGIKGLTSVVSGRSSPPFNAMILLPLIGGFVTWLLALTTIGSEAKTMARRMKLTEGPKPPVDLPY